VPTPSESSRAQALRVAGRLNEYRGEERANLLRIVGIALFYAVQLLNRYGVDLGALHVPRLEMSDQLHEAMTLVAAGWLAIAMAVSLSLRNRFFPPWLKYAVTLFDFALATIALSFADGPKSPLVVVLFPLLALSAMRIDRGLVRFATAGAVASYLWLVGLAAYVRTDLMVPRYQEILMVLALALTGVVLDAVVGASRTLAEETADRDRAPSIPPSGDAS
jgi:hypothetical protein